MAGFDTPRNNLEKSCIFGNCRKKGLITHLSYQPFDDIGRWIPYQGDSLLPMCNLLSRWNFLEQMLGQNNQVLDIDCAVAPRHRADVT